MSLKNIKSNTQAQRGFTIVELLIVVVVIAILAAITIVSYNGITNRANQSAAKAAAATIQKKAELYNSEVGNYPILTTNLTTATSDKSYATPANAFAVPSTGNTTAPTSANGKTQVQLIVCGSQAAPQTAATVEGVKVAYWDFGGTNGTAAVQNIDIGKVSGTCAPAAS
jgi:type IV pilus assembly protein PilA